MGDRQPK
jgi:hypothetical protein